MKKMTAEELNDCLDSLSDNSWKKVKDHIAALEAEAARLADIAARSALLAREKALEEVTCAVRDTMLAITLNEERATAYRQVLGLLGALKSKPAREVLCVHGAGEGVECYACHPHPVEMAPEENGLLPPRRRREHEYGEETPARFGAWLATCTRPGCEAFRLKNHNRTQAQFHQEPGAAGTRGPGPCTSGRDERVSP